MYFMSRKQVLIQKIFFLNKCLEYNMTFLKAIACDEFTIDWNRKDNVGQQRNYWISLGIR